MSKVRNIDLAWAAGFFDGEGSITLSVKDGKYIRLEVACSQKQELPLLLFKRFFDGEVYGYKQAHKDLCHQWKLHGAKAVEILKLLLPYLVVKGEDARDVITIFETRDVAAAAERHDRRIAGAATRRAIRAGLDQDGLGDQGGTT